MLEVARRSLRFKLAFVVLATTLLALMVAGAALVYYDLRDYEQRWSNDLLTQADILARASAPALAFDDAPAATQNLALLQARRRILAAALYDAQGRQVAAYQREGATPARPLPELAAIDGVQVHGEELDVFRRVIEGREVLGTVYLRASYGLNARLRDYLGILGLVMALSLVVAAVVSLRLQSALTQPILGVAEVARQVMTRRDFSLRVNKTTEDEIGTLVDAFNDMLGEIDRRAQALEASNRSLAHEIAERQRADEELRVLNGELERRVSQRTAQLEAANKELEAFSYSVSHDLRAPLRSIVGFAEALVEDHGEDLSPDARRKLDIVHQEGRRMSTLIDDLLAFSRLGRKAMLTGELDMRELAARTWTALQSQQETHRVEFELGDLPGARGDAALVAQVWVNLLSNALKFSSKTEAPRIEVGAISDDREHIYFVRDNGAGFNPKYQSKLFGVFQRLHDASEFPGTGVGLALVQRIVTRHGGRVWADSQPGEGATFYFSLPREPEHGDV